MMRDPQHDVGGGHVCSLPAGRGIDSVDLYSRSVKRISAAGTNVGISYRTSSNLSWLPGKSQNNEVIDNFI